MIDSACLALAFLFSNLVRFGDPLHFAGVDMFVITWPIFIVAAANGQAFSLAAVRSPKLGIRKSIKSLLFAAAILVGILFYTKTGALFSRQVFGVGIAAAILLIICTRWGFGRLIERRYQGILTNDILLVDGVAAQPRDGEIAVFADRAQLCPSSNDPVLRDRLGRLLQNADRVILACPPDRRTSWSNMLKAAGVEVEVLAPELDQFGALGMRSYQDRATLLIGLKPLGLRDRTVKRFLDLAVTASALVVAGPLMIAIALAIKIESPGPVLFRQPRLGRKNCIFEILKFRSMRVEAADEDGHRSACRDDDRITRVGKFLRKTSLDELPQLFNVLKSEMSIVGPRPHALASTAENALFWDIDARYWERHGIKPGLTGLAQVRGYRGATIVQSDVTKRVQADLEYLSGWNLGRDLMIMARTFRVLVHRNAF